MSVACVLAKLEAVEVVTTDFDHWTKKKKEKLQAASIEKIIYLKTLSYRNNISFTRLLSHIMFSVRAALFFRKHRNRYDIVYVTLPFNLLAWLVLRSAGTQWKIADVLDIWPDVLPFSRRHLQLFRPLFVVWRRFFDHAVSKADVMLAVSDSFFIETSKFVNTHCHKRRFYIGDVKLQGTVVKESTFTVVYVGSIGYLYDFETLLDVMEDAEHGSVQLFIVGEGDQRNWLLNELKKRIIPHQYFGVVYDSDKLANILCRAHVGFNGYVNTSAAFSYKANTYFAAALPIINSMNGDLQELVVQRGLGLNYIGGDYTSLKLCFTQLNVNNLETMSQNCAKFFVEELDRERIREDMLKYLRECHNPYYHYE
jgi:glycosyltransferase involved in cell wall biosynthesis